MPAATPPLGFVDSIDSNLIGGLRIAGWAYDPDRALTSLDVAIYLDDVLVDTVSTDRARPDVNAALGITGAHGFRYDLALDLGQHVICVEALGVDSSGNPDGVDGPVLVLDGQDSATECRGVIFYPPECESETGKGDAALLACIDEVT